MREDLLDLIRAKADAGAYADESQVGAEDLRLRALSEDALEDWLPDEVAPTYDRAIAKPDSLLELHAVFCGVRERLKSCDVAAAE